MPIPDGQLKTWSKLGTQVRSQSTYRSINHAIAKHVWPRTMGSPSVYLQGSYRNHTNIAGDSDVDVVVETIEVFYSNLPDDHFLLREYAAGQFTWRQFRDEVYSALQAHYSPGRVQQGEKCIQVGSAGDRVNADIVPCCQYRRFGDGGVDGITFWSGSEIQIVNYPELHYQNGTDKNEECHQNYKRMIRVFKNARNAARSDFPSYFLECMLYNVSSSQYSGSLGDMFRGILTELVDRKSDRSMTYWTCQNGQHRMFGQDIHQIELSKAHEVVNALVKLWNNWR